MQNNILNYLSYFDIFNHPLNKEELENLCSEQKNKSDIKALIKEKKCFAKDEYYSINENISDLIKSRKKKEKEAQKYLKKLPFYSKLIKSFPFVKGLAISGSLSKNIMYENGDIDYFIIASPGRLWICRTTLILFKKIFLLNSKKYFCLNYFVDENNLEIPDKNIFTAIELSYLAPVYNPSLFDKLKEANSWTQTYCPAIKNPIEIQKFEGTSRIKKSIESIFKGSIGDQLDLFLMKQTYKRWRKKFKHFNSEKFELTMRTNRGVSKHHPRDFQNKVLKQYKDRLVKLGIAE